MHSLHIGLSALLAAQKAIDTAGHNIANTQTPDYTRQRVDMAPRAATRLEPLAVGGGVQLLEVEGVRDAFIDRMLLAQDPTAGGATRRSKLLAELESLFTADPEASLGAAMDRFFTSFSDLARNPAGAAERGAVVHNARALTAAFNQLGDRIAEFRRGLRPYVEDAVGRVNELSAEIAGLNERIRDTVVHNGQASDLIDQRMHALRELAALTPIHVVYDDLGRADVRAGGLLLVSKDDATPLALGDDAETLAVRIGSAEGRRFQALGGEIGALLDVANRVAPEHQARLDALAATIAREVNRLHSTGVGRQGGFEQLTSTVHLDEGRPLSEAGLPFDLNPGDLVLSLRDVSTGEVTQTRVTFDPATHTLADLAAALDAVDHLTARAGSGRLQLSADAGYTFDATNRAPTAPGDLGGSAVALTGNVSLDADDTYTFTASGDGTIGTTAALTVTVTDAAGLTVAELDVGPDYEPGTLLDLPGGVAVGFGPGAVTAGDSLTVDLVAEPDAQGLFAALGLNTLFRGTTAAGIRVEPAVVADPGLVAAGRSNAASDGSNARRLAAVQEASLASLGGETVDGAYADLIGQVGLDSQMAQRSATTASLQRDAAENQRDAVSGVNQDEEAIDLLRHQQLYTFASRYIQTINGLLGDLMDIL